MQNSITTDYMIRIMCYLASSQDRISNSELSHELNIPEPCVSEINTQLEKSNLVVAPEGDYGGYTLAQNPEDISLKEIVSSAKTANLVDRRVKEDADMFYTILRVNLTDKSYECVFSHNTKIDKDINVAWDYEEFIQNYTNNFVHRDDRWEVKELLNYENLQNKDRSIETDALYRRREELHSDVFVWVELKKYVDVQNNIAVVTFHDSHVAPKNAVGIEKELQKQEIETVNYYWDMISILISVLNHNNIVETNHQDDISYYTEQVYKQLKEHHPELGITDKEIEEVSRLAPIHDIGKVKVPLEVLNKKSRLEVDEMDLIKKHPIVGAEMTLKFPKNSVTTPLMRYSYNICRFHHERYDGKGYPDGLKGEDIPLCAQVVGMVDAYDALISDRPYKYKIDPQEAIQMIVDGKCGIFSPKLVQCFLRASAQEEWLQKAQK